MKRPMKVLTKFSMNFPKRKLMLPSKTKMLQKRILTFILTLSIRRMDAKFSILKFLTQSNVSANRHKIQHTIACFLLGILSYSLTSCEDPIGIGVNLPGSGGTVGTS